MTKRSKTIRCPHCGNRFVPVKAGKGIRKHQTCPFCQEDTSPPKTRKQLKQEAWDACAKWVKLRDAYWTYGKEHLVCACVTCGVELAWDSKDLHAGHWLGGRTDAILFLECGIHPQCRACNFGMNLSRGTIKEKYDIFMLKQYGPERCEQILNAKVSSTVKWERDDFVRFREEFCELIRHKCNELGILLTDVCA